ncbi:MAG: RnfH family protein [Pseudomonadota bacterium]
MDSETNTMRVEVAYARPDEQQIIPVEVPVDCRIDEAIEASGIVEKFPEIDLDEQKVGVFGALMKLDDRLREGDRVEIYRKLIIDPKEARKNRLAKKKEKGA